MVLVWKTPLHPCIWNGMAPPLPSPTSETQTVSFSLNLLNSIWLLFSQLWSGSQTQASIISIWKQISFGAEAVLALPVFFGTPSYLPPMSVSLGLRAPTPRHAEGTARTGRPRAGGGLWGTHSWRTSSPPMTLRSCLYLCQLHRPSVQVSWDKLKHFPSGLNSIHSLW